MNGNAAIQGTVKAIMNEAENKLSEAIGKPVSICYRIRVNSISPEHLMHTVCKVCNTTYSQIIEQDRKTEKIIPRHLFIWLCAYYCGMTTTKLGRMLNRDHSTILKAITNVNDMLDTNDEAYVMPLREVEKIILKLTE